ncbi:MAG TPA: hypothetical protein EYO73_10060 [Sulfurimonas sp.]|nr:hypothetical protein [Sulfurimonas sp.]
MELKDVILSTLEELEHTKEELLKPKTLTLSSQKSHNEAKDSHALSPTNNEALFLKNMKERIHVLFEGFQSPNNANIEAKVDLTLNFLEFLLSSIETRLKEIK